MSDFAPSIPNWPYTRAKTALVRAAAAVMIERGPRGATLKNIATRAGVTEPAIFRHFPGVDGVFQALADTVDYFCNAFEAAFIAEQSGVQRLESGLRETLRMLVENPDFAFIVLHAPSVFREYAELLARVQERARRLHALALECLTQAKDSGELKEGPGPAFIADLVEGLLLRELLFWMERKTEAKPIEAFEQGWTELRKLFVRKRA